MEAASGSSAAVRKGTGEALEQERRAGSEYTMKTLGETCR